VRAVVGTCQKSERWEWEGGKCVLPSLLSLWHMSVGGTESWCAYKNGHGAGEKLHEA